MSSLVKLTRGYVDSIDFLMTPVKPRRVPSRRQKALATRERIMTAAIQVFVEHGYSGTRMTDIAELADVAVQTLYYSFSTKAELVAACMEFAVLGPERRIPTEQDFWARTNVAATGRAALVEFANGVTAILGRAGAMDEVAKAALHEPDVAAFVARSESLRREGYQKTVVILDDRFGLRPALDLEGATDVALALASSATYLPLMRAGWSDARYAAWLADALALLLLADPG